MRKTILTREASVGGKLPHGNVRPRRSRRPSLGSGEFLDIALEIFCEKGFDGTSIDAITAAAGIAKRTVYARYGDKENLFRLAIERAIDEWNVPVERLRAAETDDLEKSLFAIAQILIGNILAPAGLRLLRLTNSESGRMPWIGEHNVRYGEGPVIAYLTEFLGRHLPHAREAQFDPQDAAEIFLHLVVGGPANAAAWGVIKDEAAIERRASMSVKIFLNGLMTVSGAGVCDSDLEAVRKDMSEIVSLLSDASTRANQAHGRLRPAERHGAPPRLAQ